MHYVLGDRYFMLIWILHDWNDEYCLKLLKNCWKALPETGKVIVLHSALPEYPEGDIISTVNHFMDIGMMIVNPGGKQRTLKEFQALANNNFGVANFEVPECQ
ncbi:hypothetical protein LIER_38647 [Lithospermum erythrorhizon]|uniref:O-methyltransferase C-terminal domain-containing protein n=1 Tax=Lithospermum erythrorhizon TaxID=34254 RepID=A0AAV3Q5H5_LITER